jgi:hypothetical protein
LCFVSVLCVLFKFINHGSHWGDTAQALAQWRQPVASSEALYVLHWAMCPVSYRRIIRMVIEMASSFPLFFIIVNSVVVHNHS